MQAKKAAKTAQKVQVNYGYGETKRESVAGNSIREIFLNCAYQSSGGFDEGSVHAVHLVIESTGVT